MGVFIGYSSRDRALLERLTTALREADVETWIDEKLSGSELWWQTILTQIRDCDVFIVALSQNFLDSKACRAELQYAQALGKPVLPVQVGSVDSMRVNPLAAMQAIDYRDPTAETGIELVSNVYARQAKSQPLPDPMPDDPPMPFAYLAELASKVSASELSSQEQSMMVARLKTGLEEDGDDDGALRDISQLLYTLRDRPDVTYRTRTEVDALLATMGQDTGASFTQRVPRVAPPSPQQPATVPPTHQPPSTQPEMPVHQPPAPQPAYYPHDSAVSRPQQPGASRKWLLIGGSVFAALVAVVVVIVAIFAVRPKPAPPPPPPKLLSDSAVGSLLLTSDEVNSIVGPTTLEAGKIDDQLYEPSNMSDPGCSGAFSNAAKSVYQGSGYGALNNQVLTGEDPQRWVNQTAATFPSGDLANNVLTKSANQWKSCAGQTVRVTLKDETRWTFGEVSQDDSQIDQAATQEQQSTPWDCQHAMRVVSNVILEANVCSSSPSDQAVNVIDKMAAKMPK